MAWEVAKNWSEAAAELRDPGNISAMNIASVFRFYSVDMPVFTEDMHDAVVAANGGKDPMEAQAKASKCAASMGRKVSKAGGFVPPIEAPPFTPRKFAGRTAIPLPATTPVTVLAGSFQPAPPPGDGGGVAE